MRPIARITPTVVRWLIVSLELSLCLSCSTRSSELELDSPCDVFSVESAPVKTPVVRDGPTGMELLVSLSPALNDDAIELVEKLNRDPVSLTLQPGSVRVLALRLEDQGRVVLRVSSQVEAERIEALLCLRRAASN